MANANSIAALRRANASRARRTHCPICGTEYAPDYTGGQRRCKECRAAYRKRWTSRRIPIRRAHRRLGAYVVDLLRLLAGGIISAHQFATLTAQMAKEEELA